MRFYRIVSLFALLFLLPFNAFAQTLFQNSNTSCESELVLCSSLDSGSCLGNGDTTSISCKNILGEVDFNGDGFTDCASSLPSVGSQTQGVVLQDIDVLFNQGGSAIDCSSGSGDQFDPSINYILDFQGVDLSTMLVGSLDGANFDDLALAGFNPLGGINGDSILSAFSLAGGGFGAANSDIGDSDELWAVAGRTQEGFSSGIAERNSALIDCNNDDDLDAVIAIRETSPTDTIRFNYLENDGTGLQAITGVGDSFNTNLSTQVNDSASLTVGDFNNDGNQDVALAVVTRNESNITILQVVTVCTNDGACNFTCPAQPPIILNLIHPAQSVEPFSIVAGDFNGDGNNDLAISEPGLDGTAGNEKGIHYFFGNGAGAFPQNLHVPMLNPAAETPRVLATGCFNNDAVVDVAVSSNPEEGGTGEVELFVSDGLGGLNIPIPLGFAEDAFDLAGLDAADFDQQGGDDIIALASDNDSGDRAAYVFMNTTEVLVANAGVDRSTDIDVPTVINDASCAFNPADPTTSAFTFQWVVTNAPQGADTTLNNPTTLTPAFSGDTAGTYTLTLTCSSFIGCEPTEVTDSMDVVVQAAPPGVRDSQGGTLCSLNKNSVPPHSTKGDWIMMMILPAALLVRRLRKSVMLGLFFVLVLSGVSTHANALTTSFSVNTFQPTVDDSEYFTVYSAPTMLKRNFHVGFFLDYAHDPYEFGDQDFNRVEGIVDSLLTGNILGSYGITDWFTAGVLIPVYFWEGIRSDTFPDENNFDLGDVQLVLKFRLVDREKHHVGVAVVPFITFPSSTGSSDFLGNGSFSGGGKIVIDGRIKDRVSLALNVGYLSRDQITDVGGNDLDDQFLASLGISVDLVKDKFKLIGEGETATVAKDFFSERRTTPTEARVGFRYTWAHNHDVNLGSGFGLTNGIGSPAYRVFAGYTYTKRPVADVTVPAPPVSEIEIGDELTLGDKIYFEFDKAVVRDISQPTLDKIAAFLKAHPEVTKIRIEGHTCDLGTDSYNQKLSERRAKAIADYLMGQGVDSSRIGTVQGFGESRPIVENVDEMHREQNRRVQIFVEAVGAAETRGE